MEIKVVRRPKFDGYCLVWVAEAKVVDRKFLENFYRSLSQDQPLDSKRYPSRKLR
jgi:hypothetical protein